MTERDQEALQLCDLGLQQMWRGEIDPAIAQYDRALATCESEETRELITIRKAEALIACEREGAEVSALPMIVMRRRSPRHVYLAANTLLRRYCETSDRTKAIFYGEIARQAATELDDPFARASVLNNLGITLVADSKFTPAIEVLEEGLAAMTALGDERDDHRSLQAAIIGNLGGAKVLCGEFAEGVRLLEIAVEQLEDDYGTVEACLDLCFGYLELGRYDIAEFYGRAALDSATMPRQVRNANHLMGELCVRTERYDESDAFFDVVAQFYPDFRNVKQLLMAVDLCSVVNWKA
jgi:tetratricopeptide (TPR) repeat protein